MINSLQRFYRGRHGHTSERHSSNPDTLAPQRLAQSADSGSFESNIRSVEERRGQAEVAPPRMILLIFDRWRRNMSKCDTGFV